MAAADFEPMDPIAVLLSKLSQTLSRLEGGLTDPATLGGVEDDARRLLAALDTARQAEPIDATLAETLKDLLARHNALNEDLERRLETIRDFGSYLKQRLDG